ncbi:MAG TPA: hypothetical protein VEA92_01645 [Candidatus Paceibacterota bacterium]|nr:hypothetical protein [Candidatus Paceibacterota bacterium]
MTPQVQASALPESAVPVTLAEMGARVESLYARLKGWDMSIVKRYCVEKGLYTADEIDGIVDEYTRFLALTLAYPETRIPIAAKVDTLWHTHIIFTEDYQAFGVYMGGFMHHRPSILDQGFDLDAEFVENSIPLYERHFGKANAGVWGKALCCCSADGCSGNHVAGDFSGHVNN